MQVFVLESVTNVSVLESIAKQLQHIILVAIHLSKWFTLFTLFEF